VKIGIVSDSHDRADALGSAIRAAAAQGASAIIHCGDLIGAHTLQPAIATGLPLHLIHGNNIGDPGALHRLSIKHAGVVHYHGMDARLDLAGRRIFAVHYPEYGHAMACTGNWDVVCCGHSHCAGIECVDNVLGQQTWLVNPGTVAGISAPAMWVLGDLATLQFTIQTTPVTAP
jgi:uncharacterized protein